MKLKEDMQKYHVRLSDIISGANVAAIILLLVLGCIFSGEITDRLARIKNSIFYEKTDGVVTDSFFRTTGKDKTFSFRKNRTGGTMVQVAVIGYQADGTAYTLRQVTSGLELISEGTKYTVRYDPKHPEKAYVEYGGISGKSVLWIVFGMLLFSAAFFLIWKEYQKVKQVVNRRKRWEQEERDSCFEERYRL